MGPSLLFPIFVILTDNVTSYINISNVDILMLTIFGAILFGISSGIIFKAGYNSGGTDILSKIYSKYFKTSIGSANLIVNVLIIISSGFIFGINNMLYAIISLYIMSLLNDKILLGINNNKTILIVTNKPKDIRKFIINKLERGVTILYGYGGFTNDKNEVILVVIPNTEYFLLKENILNIDNKAFFVVLNSYQANY